MFGCLKMALEMGCVTSDCLSRNTLRVAFSVGNAKASSMVGINRQELKIISRFFLWNDGSLRIKDTDKDRL